MLIVDDDELRGVGVRSRNDTVIFADPAVDAGPDLCRAARVVRRGLAGKGRGAQQRPGLGYRPGRRRVAAPHVLVRARPRRRRQLATRRTRLAGGHHGARLPRRGCRGRPPPDLRRSGVGRGAGTSAPRLRRMARHLHHRTHRARPAGARLARRPSGRCRRWDGRGTTAPAGSRSWPPPRTSAARALAGQCCSTHLPGVGQAGATSLGLSVQAENRGALKLYLGVGLRIDREWMEYVPAGG